MFNVRVEYEAIPIRRIAVQCPKCNKWFSGWDIVKDSYPLRYAHDINWTEFECPICGKEFGGLQHNNKANIKEDAFSDVYDRCVRKKEVWE